MRLSSPHLHRHALALAALLLALVAPSACGPDTVPGGTLSPSTPPHTVVRSATSQVPASTPSTRVSATCLPGEQMIGGGYAASDTFEYDVKIASSYPSSASQWSVEASSSPAFSLQVDAYCLVAGPALGVQIVHAPIAPAGRVTCPANTHLLAGGFQAAEATAASHPDANGWTATTIGTTGQVYALCAAHDLSTSTPSATYNPHSTPHSDMPGSTELACPPNQTPTSGGFSSGDLILTNTASPPPSTRWTFTLGGDADVTIYAVCATLSA